MADAAAGPIATLLTAWPERQRLSPYLDQVPVPVVLGALNDDSSGMRESCDWRHPPNEPWRGLLNPLFYARQTVSD